MKKILIILCSVSAMGIGNAAWQGYGDGSWNWLTGPAEKNYFVEQTQPTGEWDWLTEPARAPAPIEGASRPGFISCCDT